MNYKLLIFFFAIILSGCVVQTEKKQLEIGSSKSFFITKGFTLVYDDQLYADKLVEGKIEERSLIIFQKNLKKNTNVKITNLNNSKYIIAQVGKKTDYPIFFNSVISQRISKELEIDQSDPYVEIIEIRENSTFIAKKAMTYNEEKKVATKAPVDEIKIKDLSNTSIKKSKKINNKFSYIIKIADFYFEKSAIQMKSRIINETSVKKVYIDKLSSTKFRVFLGPYSDLNSLKNSFNAINILQFENIEIIKK